jgi:soluble lytic murein transglycosylase-like protein
MLAMLAFVATLTLGAPGAAHADVYYFVDANGGAHFTDRPGDPGARLILRSESTLPVAPTRRGAGNGWGRGNGQRFEAEVLAAAQAARIEAALLHAVVAVESGYNPQAISPKGAIGLMQLMPDVARQYGVNDPTDAAQNLMGGARYLRDLLDQFANDKSLALAAYNAGANAVLAYGGRIPPYPETARYVPAVLQYYAHNRAAPAKTPATRKL